MSTGTTNVIVNPLPTPTATSNSPVCTGQPINFMGAGGTTYTWSGPGLNSNAQNPVIAVAQATNGGTYTLSVTNANGCSNSVTTNVVINPLPVIAVNNPTSCVNQNINLTASGGTAYAWSGPLGYTSPLQNPVIPNAQLNMSGGYTVLVTSAFGCTNTSVANVTVITLPNPVIVSNTPCVGATLSFTGTGGASYNWSGPNGFNSPLQNPNIPNVTIAANGIYTLIATAGTCSNAVTASVTVNPLPVPTATSNSPVCVNQAINFTGTGGTTYTWSGPLGYASNAQNPVIAVAQASNNGTYTLTVTNANGCSNSVTTNVVVNPLPVIAVNNPTVCVNQNINLTSTGGAAYSWNGPNAYTSPLQNPLITNAQVNMSGGYTVMVTTGFGCTSTAVANVSVITLPMPAINSNTPCAGSTLNLTGTGGGLYSWSGPNGFSSPAQNPNITNVSLAAGGTYTLIVTAGTCSNLTTALITINPLPIPTATSNNPVCVNQPINLSGAGGTTYSWAGPGAYSSPNQNPVIAIAQASNAGTYTLTVTNANSCTNTITTSVAVNPLPVVTANNPTVCLNTNINLTSGGASTYAWAGPNGFTSNTQNPNIAFASLGMNGQYTVTGTSAFGCTNTALSTVLVLPLPSPAISSNGPVCIGATLNFTAAGGATYSWSGPNGFASPSSNPNIANTTLAAGGTYSLVATVGSCTNITTALIVINPLPTPNLTSNSPVCIQQSINFFAGGGNTYIWAGPNGFTGNGSNLSIPSANNTNAGTYTLTVTDGNNCTNTISTAVSINPLPVISAVGSTLCALKTISLSASGGTAFTWSGPNGFTSASPQEYIPNADITQQGNYSVTVTNSNGCTSSSVTNVHINPIPTLTASANTPICVNQTISLSAGALTGTSYLWTGPNGYYSIKQNSQIIDATLLTSGIYTITVTDNIGCSTTAMVNMQVNDLPVVSISSDKRSGCVPVCINFSPQSSTSIQSCYWKFGEGSSAGGLSVQKCYANPGSFEVSAKFTDINGCSNTGTFSVETYPIPVADFNYASAKPIINETVEFTDASYGANVTGWTWNFSHLKNQVALKSQTSLSYENPGSYAVALVVTSDHGCRDTTVKSITIGDDFGIFVPDAFTPNGDGINDIFQPKGYGIVKYELNIFDRWGERLFTTSDFTQGWDGVFSGRGADIVKEDVYIWNIKVITIFGKAKELSGRVTLFR